ncbi:MAG: dCMP deaminase family protein [Bacilli bacterium]|nr:dCMP deaminase family protein [Bacilli bacterium]
MINEIDKKYMLEALEEAKNANCIKGKVGAIIVKDNIILGKGNNSVPNGTKPCTEKTCIRKLLNLKSGERQELCKVVHAEQNAILNALFNKNDINGSTIYVTKSPCMICAKILINAGIKKVVYANKYPDEETFKILTEAGVSTHCFPL